MNLLSKKLKTFGSIGISIVGAGLMGKSLVSQLNILENMKVDVLSSNRIESVLEAYNLAGIENEKIVVTNDLEIAQQALAQGLFVATTNNELVYLNSYTHCVVDCTGNTNGGCEISYNALLNKKHVVSLNVEADVVVGHILKRTAEENGVIYTGSYGDEPGAIQELYEFAEFLGFEILAAGKGKNNKLDYSANPTTLKDEALEKGVSPRMLTSFVDGTNTMIELNAFCNSTGLLPDVGGCHVIHSDINTLPEKMSLKSEGGILNNYGVVDFVMGVAPGVFVIVRSKSPIVDYEMQYLKMGKGPNYAIYRPYHLTSLETPISIVKAVVEKETSIVAQFERPIAETIAVAKRNIKKGEVIDGIGGYTVYGRLEAYEKTKAENLVPIGLICGNAVAKEDISKGCALDYSMIELDESTFIYKLKKIQEKVFNF